jgi:uncharacterized membrane protein
MRSKGGSAHYNRFMWTRVLDIVTLVLTALVMGVFWGTWFTLTRSLEVFSAAEFIHIGKTIIANVGGPMAVLMPLTLAAMLVATWLRFKKDKRSFYLHLISLLLMVATLIITLMILVPIDNQIATWTPETVPGNWESLRTTWDNYHTVRTFTSISSFAALAVGVVRNV